MLLVLGREHPSAQKLAANHGIEVAFFQPDWLKEELAYRRGVARSYGG
jgi:hypothetical protein